MSEMEKAELAVRTKAMTSEEKEVVCQNMDIEYLLRGLSYQVENDRKKIAGCMQALGLEG